MRWDTASLVLLLLGAPAGCGGDARAAEVGQPPEVVRAFLQAIASGDAERVAGFVRTPLDRPHPLPPVRDAADFVARFDELLPASLRAELLRSTADDWARVGWRGTMFDNGRLWIDDDGELWASNEHSPLERRRRLELIARDRASLHEDLRAFDEPVLRWRTSRYRVRVDRMADGALRYASWRRDAPMAARPDLVLSDGEHQVEGTARNETYRWQNGKTHYVCAMNRVGPNGTPPYELRVTRGDEVLLDEPAEPFYP